MVDLCKKKKKKRGLPFGVQLPRDGMKILQWSSNPKLPSKNIPLPPERDPDLFACRAGAGRGWAARTGGQVGDRQGQGDGRSGQVQFAGLGRSLKWGAALSEEIWTDSLCAVISSGVFSNRTLLCHNSRSKFEKSLSSFIMPAGL